MERDIRKASVPSALEEESIRGIVMNAMKKKTIKLILSLLVVCGFAACGKQKSEKLLYNQENNGQKDNQLSFSKLEDLSEITVEGNTVTIVLLQDIPLPYRWGITYQSENVSIIEEYEVEETLNDSLFSVGSAEEYHVFVFELKESDLAQLEFYNLWIVEPENLEEANGSRKFTFEYVDGKWIVQGVD